MGDDDLKFKHSFSCIVSDPSKSGKTSFSVRLLQNLDSLCTETNSVAALSGVTVRRLPFRKVSSCPLTPNITKVYRITLVLVVNRAS